LSFKDAGLACAKRESGRPPLREERPKAAGPALPSGKGGPAAGKGRFLILERQGARRKTGGRMIPPRREKAVLAHSRANLKGHFGKNGYKRALPEKWPRKGGAIRSGPQAPRTARQAGGRHGRQAGAAGRPASGAVRLRRTWPLAA